VRKILIVNLTRFGDLLQTSPTIAGLKEAHPDAEVTVLAERNFADVCRGLPGVDRVRELDLDGLGRLVLGGTGPDLRAAYRTVAAVVEELRGERYDLALNYSSSRMSAVLMRLIGVADTRGWTMTDDGHRLIAHRWSRLFSASALTRRQAPFNLVDYYKRVAGVPRGPQHLLYTVSAAARAEAAAVLAGAGHRGEPLVAFQLGASRDVRRWPTASFVAVGRTLVAEAGARILLCGGGGERAAAAEVAAGLGASAIDVCGRTSIATLAALLERAGVLLTGDTGPMHLAVAVGTPVVALFFGPALPVDTGPYGVDHVCLHADVPCAPCDHNVTCLEPFCRETLAPAAVADAVLARLRGDAGALAAAADRWAAVAWYRTDFDAEGLFEAVPLGVRATSARERLRRAYRVLWKFVLEGTPPAPPVGVPLPGEAHGLRELARLGHEAAATAAEVEALARRTASGAEIDRLESAARRLEEQDAGLFRFGAVHEAAALLTQVFRFDKESLEGDNVLALATATRRLHDDLAAHARLLADLLDPPAAAARSHRVRGDAHASVA
jgi:ADP-heptose:LPS heptosyltransferase